MAKFAQLFVCIAFLFLLLDESAALKCTTCVDPYCKTSEPSTCPAPPLGYEAACLFHAYKENNTAKERFAKKCVNRPKGREYQCVTQKWTEVQVNCMTCDGDFCNDAVPLKCKRCMGPYCKTLEDETCGEPPAGSEAVCLLHQYKEHQNATEVMSERRCAYKPEGKDYQCFRTMPTEVEVKCETCNENFCNEKNGSALKCKSCVDPCKTLEDQTCSAPPSGSEAACLLYIYKDDKNAKEERFERKCVNKQKGAKYDCVKTKTSDVEVKCVTCDQDFCNEKDAAPRLAVGLLVFVFALVVPKLL